MPFVIFNNKFACIFSRWVWSCLEYFSLLKNEYSERNLLLRSIPVRRFAEKCIYTVVQFYPCFVFPLYFASLGISDKMSSRQQKMEFKPNIKWDRNIMFVKCWWRHGQLVFSNIWWRLRVMETGNLKFQFDPGNSLS